MMNRIEKKILHYEKYSNQTVDLNSFPNTNLTSILSIFLVTEVVNYNISEKFTYKFITSYCCKMITWVRVGIRCSPSLQNFRG